jgi:hypothetical protein
MGKHDQRSTPAPVPFPRSEARNLRTWRRPLPLGPAHWPLAAATGVRVLRPQKYDLKTQYQDLAVFPRPTTWGPVGQSDEFRINSPGFRSRSGHPRQFLRVKERRTETRPHSYEKLFFLFFCGIASMNRRQCVCVQRWLAG